MTNQLTQEGYKNMLEHLKFQTRRGNTRAVNSLIRSCPEFVKGVAEEMQKLALENNFPRTAKAFRRALADYAIKPYFDPGRNRCKCGAWMTMDMSTAQSERDKVKMISLCMLNIAQSLGELEHRRVYDKEAFIYLSLPVRKIKGKNPPYTGKDPTYLGKHPDALPGCRGCAADSGTPEYAALISRRLNTLSQDKLWWIARQLAQWLDESRAVGRMLAVIDYDPQRVDKANLQYVFGDRGPLDAAKAWHINAIKSLPSQTLHIIKPFFGPKLLSAML